MYLLLATDKKSFTMNFYIVTWSGSSLEVLKSSKVICLDKEKIGGQVLMKFKGATWRGVIESIWGKSL